MMRCLHNPTAIVSRGPYRMFTAIIAESTVDQNRIVLATSTKCYLGFRLVSVAEVYDGPLLLFESVVVSVMVALHRPSLTKA